MALFSPGRSRSETARPESVHQTPFLGSGELNERMSRLLEPMRPEAGHRSGELLWRPPADISETDTAYVVEIDLPGVRKKDLAIETYDRELVVHGELREGTGLGRLWRRSRRVGRFGYSTALPGPVDAANVTAHLENGVLRITAPKAHVLRPRRIRLNGG